ncbi:MAG: class I SAM-dependent methyltransferase [Actinobacteria bacterium]|nr:class I SAM-dependent methyltransferase [Actinomycetota bacterium]
MGKGGRFRSPGGYADDEDAMGAGVTVPAYSRTADIYDLMVGRYAFDMWRENFEKLCRIYPIDASSVADIACGTGLASRYLALQGSEVVATDISARMLMVAASAPEAGRVRYMRQDMRRLALPRRVTLLICATDALNHLLLEEGFRLAMASFRAALTEGGHALFDLNTAWQLREGCDSEPWCFEMEGYTMRWVSRWDEERNIATLVMECEGPEGEVFVEVHRERGYDTGFVIEEALRCGFRGIEAHDARGLGRPTLRSRRIQFVAWA